MTARRILVVRLGSMGDVIHTLPAAAALKQSIPGSHLAWVIDPRWLPLLDGNPFLDEVIPFDRRRIRDYFSLRRRLSKERFDTVVDFQGLVKSAFIASLAGPDRLIGFHPSQIRERPASLFYSSRVLTRSRHIVDQNLELAAAAGATNACLGFPLPKGKPEGRLPQGDFVLASPLGGWPGKQWPLDYYRALAGLVKQEADLPLVLNGPPGAAAIESVAGAWPHHSGIDGLIHATARASAVVGIDSGPMHLAAAMRKPGVAVFGPTDPARNGPYGDSFIVLRNPAARTTYKRHVETDESMRQVTPEAVCEALLARIERGSRPGKAPQ